MTESVSKSAAHQVRYTLAAGATAVVIGIGFTVVGLNRHSSDAAANRAASDAPLVTQPPADLGDAGTGPDLLLDDAASASAPPSATPSATSPSPAASPSPSRTTSRPKPRPTKRRTTAPAIPTRPKNPPATSGSIIDQVLGHINAARADKGLGAYTLDSSLSKASALHNQLMIDGCGLSHQCSGEGGIGDRFSAQGVRWSSAGENIGYGSAGGGDSDIIKAANGLTDSMLAEVPPNDGHRKNLLSSGFQRIGLSVVRDGKGIVWMTQDFVG
ncbi:CAP domain-containing protein [Couchioplanes caeruleus]|uniref:CAP domain-containing protein n=1 Tax=Couchioplanes caeruleus TaxID=56438 RepID=UPI0020BDBEDE|nr:CAP domain-containing protein [Couchioplanes caeruleus]UQU67280.1 CAP domain-containing protein [Couchioplanes caeruleus]